jgi:hypothetical protein
MFSFRRDLDAMNRTSSSLADRLASSCFHHHVFILEFGRTLTTLEATLERYLMRSLSSWQLSYAALKKQVRVSMVKWPWEPENLATHRSGCSHTNIMSWCRIRLILTDIVRCFSSVTHLQFESLEPSYVMMLRTLTCCWHQLDPDVWIDPTSTDVNTYRHSHTDRRALKSSSFSVSVRSMDTISCSEVLLSSWRKRSRNSPRAIRYIPA